MKAPDSQAETAMRQAYWQGHKDGLKTALEAVEGLDFDYYASYGMILAKTALKQAKKKAEEIDEMELPASCESTHN
jgi:ABC-type transport system involved in cytochrome c biogenesis ATPase subunit